MKLLPRYDQEMFDFHHKIEALEEQWGREKQELAKVELLILLKIETKGQTFWKSIKKGQTFWKSKQKGEVNIWRTILLLNIRLT